MQTIRQGGRLFLFPACPPAMAARRRKKESSRIEGNGRFTLPALLSGFFCGRPEPAGRRLAAARRHRRRTPPPPPPPPPPLHAEQAKLYSSKERHSSSQTPGGRRERDGTLWPPFEEEEAKKQPQHPVMRRHLPFLQDPTNIQLTSSQVPAALHACGSGRAAVSSPVRRPFPPTPRA